MLLFTLITNSFQTLFESCNPAEPGLVLTVYYSSSNNSNALYDPTLIKMANNIAKNKIPMRIQKYNVDVCGCNGQVQSFPTTILKQNGVELNRIVGVRTCNEIAGFVAGSTCVKIDPSTLIYQSINNLNYNNPQNANCYSNGTNAINPNSPNSPLIQPGTTTQSAANCYTNTADSQNIYNAQNANCYTNGTNAINPNSPLIQNTTISQSGNCYSTNGNGQNINDAQNTSCYSNGTNTTISQNGNCYSTNGNGQNINDAQNASCYSNGTTSNNLLVQNATGAQSGNCFTTNANGQIIIDTMNLTNPQHNSCSTSSSSSNNTQGGNCYSTSTTTNSPLIQPNANGQSGNCYSTAQNIARTQFIQPDCILANLLADHNLDLNAVLGAK